MPSDWRVVSFGALMEFQNGANAEMKNYGHGVPFINVLEVITHSHLRVDDIPGRVSLSNAAVETFLVRRGDVVFNRTSETQNEVGLAAVYLGDEAVVFGGFVIRGRPIGGQIDSRYAGFAFRTPQVRKQIVARGQGAIRSNIGQRELRQVLVFIPSLEEQRVIANALADADALIQSLEQLLAKKRLIRQGVMQQLLTGAMRLPGFRRKWDITPMGELFAFSGGYSAARDQLSADGHLYLHYGDIHAATSPFVDVDRDAGRIPRLDIPLSDVAPKSLLRDGDVVFVDASEDDDGASKHVVVVNREVRPFISGLHTIVAKRRSDEWSLQYLGYCFQSEAIKRQFRFFAVGTKVTGISKTNIAKVVMPVPSKNEQTAIAEVFVSIDSEIDALETKLAKARQIKQGMMQNLLTGKIRLI